MAPQTPQELGCPVITTAGTLQGTGQVCPACWGINRPSPPQRALSRSQSTQRPQTLAYPSLGARVLISLFVVENTQLGLADILVFLANHAENLP